MDRLPKREQPEVDDANSLAGGGENDRVETFETGTGWQVFSLVGHSEPISTVGLVAGRKPFGLGQLGHHGSPLGLQNR
jgi:hypothetical protein